MNIIEVKNNLVKLCYEKDLCLSGLLAIKDTHKSYIAQVLHLEATRIGKVAIAKILFNVTDKIHAYDGSIPSLRAEIQPLDIDFLLNTLNHDNPIVLGKIAAQNTNFVVNAEILRENPIILAEKFYVTKILLNNLALQLQARKQKLVVFDTAGIFKSNKLTITKDFKLPLNFSTINYIYEKGFEDATAESKALIQSIFEELSEYSKTVDFIPFDTFKSVIDSEFMRTRLMQLIVMKNKVKQIRDWNVFAQNTTEFDVLKQKLVTDDTVVLDISCLKSSLQQECIKYVYSVLKEINAEFYAFTPLSNSGTDKFLLSQILNTENVYTTLICDYDFKYLADLKKCSKNMLMFTPLKQQKDFGGYNIFLQKLAEDEFIAYGKMSKFVPIICRLNKLTASDIFVPRVQEALSEIPQTTVQQESDVQTYPSEFVQELDEIGEEVVKTKVEEVIEEEPPVIEEVEEELLMVEEAIEEEPPVIEEVEEELPVVEEVIEEEPPVIEEVEEELPVVEEVIEEEPPVIEEVEEEPPVVEEVTETEQQETTVAEPIREEEQSEVQSALNEVEDISDDEELSDDDLDMIEELSKPNEEIEALQEEPVSVAQELAMQAEQQVQTVQDTVMQPEPMPAEPVQEAEPVPQANVEKPVPEPPQQVEEEIQNAQIPQQTEPLQTRANSTPVVPEYSAEIPEEDKVRSDALQEGDKVFHEEFGEGIVEKMINYGDKILCSVNFATVGRRLLNPEISEMKKV